ncbi:MAG: RHS repeat-associated core domain-containing protein [bacterium]|nr:RHS repeat-associated core domain-containing protein [bacterium]
MKFTGHERDFFAAGESDDLDYMHARYCSPHLSRFMSVDPVLGNPAIPQSWNRYAYALNSPINYTDPSGNIAFAAALGAAWVAFEVAGSIADVVEVIDVWTDSNASLGAKLGTTGFAAVGLAAPGSGYSKLDDAVGIADDLVGGARRGDDLVDLFRAVGPDELGDIQNTGKLINRGSAEGKYFTSSVEGASDYARQAVRAFGDPPYTTIRTQIPRSHLPASVDVDGGIPAYVIPDDTLPSLVPEILSSMPIPRRP